MTRPEGMNKPYILGKDGQERMIRNGWRLMLSEWGETEADTFARLSAKWEKVKIYEDTTMVRGYHKHFAMVKNYRH